MKICTECKWFDRKEGGHCYRHRNARVGTNRVNGRPIYGRETKASEEREPPFPFDILFGACGRRGRFWEPKESSE